MSSIAHPDLPGDRRPSGPVDTASGLPFDVTNVSGSPAAMPHSSRRPPAGRNRGRWAREGYEGGISPISGCHVPGRRYDYLCHPDAGKDWRPEAPDYSQGIGPAHQIAAIYGGRPHTHDSLSGYCYGGPRCPFNLGSED